MAKRRTQLMTWIASPNARLIVFVLFMICVFLMGGGSRGDIQSLIILRPLSVLFAAFALFQLSGDRWSKRLFPIWFILALMLLAIVQLVPLPPTIWTNIPGREAYAEILQIGEIQAPWRPISVSPSGTINTFFSLFCPLAAMLLYLNVDRRDQSRAIALIIVLMLVSAMFALFQIVGGLGNNLYLYRVTNDGASVGLFANRNHQAVMLASTILILGWYGGSRVSSARFSSLIFYVSFALILIFVPLVLVTGSRAGFLLMVPATLLAILFLFDGRYFRQNRKNKDKLGTSRAGVRGFPNRYIAIAIAVALIAALIGLSIYLSRSLALDRLLIVTSAEEQRASVMPTLFVMLKENFPWGTGFGSFEHVYKAYETPDLMRPEYLNHAHNDWLQFFIEGGLGAFLIAVTGLVWLIRITLPAMPAFFNSRGDRHRATMSIFVLAFLLAASIGDYPLRVPSIMASLGILICVYADSLCDIRDWYRRNSV